LAKTGTGKPVTQFIDYFSCETVPIVLFDTKGYEVGSEKERVFIEDVFQYAARDFSSSESDNSIHLVWYCIQASGGRILDFDIETINKLSAYGIPVAIVITKAEFLSENESIKFIEVIKNHYQIYQFLKQAQKTMVKNGSLKIYYSGRLKNYQKP